MTEHANSQFSTSSWQKLWPGRVIGQRAIMIAGSLWLLLHVLLFMGTGQIGVSSFKTLLVLVAAAGVAGVADLKRNKESVFLENLGVAPFVVPAIWIAVIVLLETLTALLVP